MIKAMPLSKSLAPGLFLLVALASPQPTHAQSFDCRRAKSITERTVCATPELRQLDDELAGVYRRVTTTSRLRNEARRLQASWQKEQRDRCGANFGCLAAAYRDMLATLRALPSSGDGAVAFDRKRTGFSDRKPKSETSDFGHKAGKREREVTPPA